MTIEKLYSIFLTYPSIQTDTRKLQKGDIYFALKGERFNGNLFAIKAIELGASYVIVDEEPELIDDRILLVEDVLTTLQDLAKYHRLQFSIPFLAITGSNGKTTTKELIHAVLSTQYKTYTTKGNLNNHIGIPLTLLSIQQDAEIAVIEMGANHQKEIEGYCQYVLPTHGIITNCGKAHIEGFGGIEGVRKGKGELYNYLKDNNGTAFICNDYDYLLEMSKGIENIFYYGSNTGRVVGKPETNDTFLKVKIENPLDNQIIKTQLVGDYNLPNVLVSILVGDYFKVSTNNIVEAIENYIPTNGRSQMFTKGTNQIILDAYNANPTSMRAAILNFAQLDFPKKYLFLGGMMELGEDSIAEHAAILTLLKQYQWTGVILVGGDYQQTPHPYHFFENVTVAKKWLDNNPIEDAAILIKGSRSFEMEKLII